MTGELPPDNPARGPRPGHESDPAPRQPGRFVTTTVEIEGREETRVVETPAFELSPWDDAAELRHVGQRLPRVDAVEKITGRARYTTDVALPAMLHAVLVRATIPRGRVTRLDVAPALAMPGVVDAVTVAELPRSIMAGGVRLFDQAISYAGQPIAAVCADTEALAREAARLVIVEYSAEPFAVTVEAAVAADAPRVRRTGNLSRESPMIARRGDAARGMAEADVRISAEYRTPVALHSALEPHGAVAQWDGDRLTVWESTQGVFRTRDNLATAFAMPRANVRVLMDYMGGGFGAKNGAGAHTYAAAVLARRLGFPVRCVNDREGEQLDTGNRPSSVQRVELGATRDGRLTAITLDADIPLGIGGWEGGPAKIYHELYSCPNVRTSERFVYVNLSAMAAFRAPGHAEGAFGLECAMDELALALGMDPVALRMVNFAEHDEEKDRPFSRNELRRCYEEGAARFGWGTASATADANREGVRRGVGMAAQTWGAGGGPSAYATVHVQSDGSVTVLTGAQDLGTGARTVFAQVAADALGADPSRVRVVLGDTERLPYAGNSWGSQTTPSVAPAVRMAAEDARRQLLEAAAEILGDGATAERLVTADSVVREVGSDRTITFADLGRRLGNVMIVGRGSRGPNPERTSLATMGAQFVEVEVDEGTGVVRVIRIVAAHHAGRILNPTLAESQLEGGILQGVGYALFEERIVDERLGLVLNPGLHDYKIPVMADAPDIDAFFVSGADTVANHTGARGLAEPPIIPTAPAIANAVANAARRRVREIPLTPWRVLAADTEGPG